MDDYKKYENGISLLNGRYKFHSNIQIGSFGQVTKAVDMKNNNSFVAVKSIPKKNQEFNKIALNEIKVLTILKNESSRLKRSGIWENIVQMIEFFETDTYIIIILEYCNQGDLYDKLTAGNTHGVKSYKCNSKQFNDLCFKLSIILSSIHSIGIFHRDLKPENILFHNGTIKLADWGLATTVRFNHDMNIGTENYMAPECFKGDLVIDSRSSDYWSLGVTLLYVLFGKVPFKKLYQKSNSSNIKRSEKNYGDFLSYVKELLSEVSFEALLELISFDSSLRSLNNFFNNISLSGYDDNETTEDVSTEISYTIEDDELVFQMDDYYVRDSTSSTSQGDSYKPFNQHSSTTVTSSSYIYNRNSFTASYNLKAPSLYYSNSNSGMHSKWIELDDENLVSFQKLNNNFSSDHDYNYFQSTKTNSLIKNFNKSINFFSEAYC